MNLTEIREKIDKIDEQIVDLLLKRLDIMYSILENKIGLDKEIEDDTREKEVLSKIKELSNEDAKYIIEIYKEIIKSSKQKQLDILYENYK